MSTEGSEFLPVGPNSTTPHKDKLTKLAANPKLPEADKVNVRLAVSRYEAWVEKMNSFSSWGDNKIKDLVEALNEYYGFVELELVWGSTADFLFRQRGQLKLGSSIVEEFLPRLVDPTIIPALEGENLSTGPRRTFSGAYFAASLSDSLATAGLRFYTKDQDFTVGRPVHLQSSFDKRFPSDATSTQETYIAYIAAECKTNLDKSMFQGATATARDLKNAVPGSRYYLLCEWLDMTPISTVPTDIDEVIILRGRRMGAKDRQGLASARTRKTQRDRYAQFLKQNPINPDRIIRFVGHMRSLFDTLRAQEEQDTLERGYF